MECKRRHYSDWTSLFSRLHVDIVIEWYIRKRLLKDKTKSISSWIKDIISMYVHLVTCLDSIHFIDDKSLVVDGYIRDHQYLLKHTNQYLPFLVNDIILMYIISQTWDKLNKGWYISCDGDQIVQTGGTLDSHFGNLFTKSFMSRNIHHWLFKVHVINTDLPCTLGVIEYDKQLTSDDLQIWDHHNAIGFTMNEGCLTYPKWTPYGVKVQQHDVVKMIVDLNKQELSYSVNHKHCGKAFDLRKTKYRFVLTIGGKGEFHLLSYTMNL
eukprot:193839_1